MTTAVQINEQDLARRIAEATPEQMVAMLLEAAQRFLGQAVQAMVRKDHAAKGQALSRVSEIIDELSSRLNRENGGEVADNLARIYNWWTCELVLASLQNEPEPFENIGRWMGELGESWEQAHQMRMPTTPSQGAQVMGLPA
jgi:flagellar protein FliS